MQEKRALHTLNLNRSDFDHSLFDSKQNGLFLLFPNESKELEEFHLFPIPIFSPEQAEANPQIKAFRGESTQRKGVFMRITVSPLGIYGTMRTPTGLVFLQPNSREAHHMFRIQEPVNWILQLNYHSVKQRNLKWKILLSGQVP